MKKVALLVALAAVVAASAIGTMALADKGGNPNYGSSPLGSIGPIMDKLDAMEQAVSDVQTKVTAIETALGNVSEIESYADVLFGESVYLIWESPVFDQGAYFNISIWASDFSLWPESEMHLDMELAVPGQASKVEWQEVIDSNGLHTFQFHAANCTITCEGNYGLDIAYAVTVVH